MTDLAGSAADQPAGGPPAWPSWPLTAAPPAPLPPLVRPVAAQVALWALLAALGAGVLAQLLFFNQLPGINYSIWVIAVLAAALVFRPAGAPFDRLDLSLPAAAVLFALFTAIRDDGPLLLFDILAAGTLTLASVIALSGREVSRAAFGRLVRAGGAAIFVAWTGAVQLVPGVRLLALALRPRSGSNVVRVLRGVLLALPLVLVFVALFAAADAVFETYLNRAIAVQLDWPQLTGRTVFAILATWLFAGTMVVAWLGPERDQPAAGPDEHRGRLGSVEAVVLLLAIDAVFAVFVILQAAYLFGGLDTLALTGMTYSEYARRGFFELIAVALVAGGVILAVDAIVVVRTRIYKLTAVALAALTGIVLISALVRLGLYQMAYGWTELRFYALSAIGWLAAGVLATVVGLALGRVGAVWRIMLAAGVLIAFLCNAIGPQSFVTQQNVARAADPSLVAPGGQSGLDVDYLRRLGADATSVLVADLDLLPAADQAAVRNLLADSDSRLSRQASEHGWPSWNLARSSALDSLTAAGF
jgi:hypothetical protein